MKAGIAQSVEQRTENPCVTSSNLVPGTEMMATWPSGKARDCKSFIPQFKSGCRLLNFRELKTFFISLIYVFNAKDTLFKFLLLYKIKLLIDILL